ncbi:homoaconitate hydratase, variant 2 [Coprinopsis cinerea AmutBmut pab1-1]|nr:homoaconitate hydratase, variant 2 [Coprinopsis cinerea AmutBmut pab1-1]
MSSCVPHGLRNFKDQDYPGILPSSESEALVGRELSPSERTVRGTFVTGLTAADMILLDGFEDDVSPVNSSSLITLRYAVTDSHPQEYRKATVDIHPLTPLIAVNDHPGEDQELVLLHASPLPTAECLPCSLKAETYVYSVPTGLEPDLWSFDDFVKNNARKWFDYQPQ